MTFVHIVLLKVKPAIASSGSLAELKSGLDTLKTLPIVASNVQSLSWHEPAFSERAQGYNYGLYTTFGSRELYEQYAADEEHRNFSKTKILPNVDGEYYFHVRLLNYEG